MGKVRVDVLNVVMTEGVLGVRFNLIAVEMPRGSPEPRPRTEGLKDADAAGVGANHLGIKFGEVFAEVGYGSSGAMLHLLDMVYLAEAAASEPRDEFVRFWREGLFPSVIAEAGGFFTVGQEGINAEMYVWTHLFATKFKHLDVGSVREVVVEVAFTKLAEGFREAYSELLGDLATFNVPYDESYKLQITGIFQLVGTMTDD